MEKRKLRIQSDGHYESLLNYFSQCLSIEKLVDVTLVCEDFTLKAHKIILSAFSPMFETIFLENPCMHSIMKLKDIKYHELKTIIEYIYQGEVIINRDQLPNLIKVAKSLQVKGLADVDDTTIKKYERESKDGIIRQQFQYLSQSLSKIKNDAELTLARTKKELITKQYIQNRKRSNNDSIQDNSVSISPKVKQESIYFDEIDGVAMELPDLLHNQTEANRLSQSFQSDIYQDKSIKNEEKVFTEDLNSTINCNRKIKCLAENEKQILQTEDLMASVLNSSNFNNPIHKLSNNINSLSSKCQSLISSYQSINKKIDHGTENCSKVKEESVNIKSNTLFMNHENSIKKTERTFVIQQTKFSSQITDLKNQVGEINGDNTSKNNSLYQTADNIHTQQIKRSVNSSENFVYSEQTCNLCKKRNSKCTLENHLKYLTKKYY